MSQGAPTVRSRSQPDQVADPNPCRFQRLVDEVSGLAFAPGFFLVHRWRCWRVSVRQAKTGGSGEIGGKAVLPARQAVRPNGRANTSHHDIITGFAPYDETHAAP